MEEFFFAYHVVTERPMAAGQVILFDETHHSGVYSRVQAKSELAQEILKDPKAYKPPFEHHTAVALRELALEEVRLKEYPRYPSRMSCLYVTETLREANDWADYFIGLGRPTYQIVKLSVKGRCFKGDASRCFDGTGDQRENLRNARLYWQNEAEPGCHAVPEMLVDGEITVLEILREINANLPDK